jgi:choline dehydrogenase-like flavoprotein
MFVAFDAQHDWANYDFVVIGAGVAGLFLAEKFAPAGRVLVIEAGGKDPGGLGEGYYDIDSTGRPYGALGKRLSSFGGTSNHWGGHSHPLSPAIFGNRPGYPGWPITYADYALHLSEAQSWVHLGAFEKAPGSTEIERDLLNRAENLTALHFQFSNPILRLGDAATQQRYAARPGIDIVLDTRVTDIHLDDGGTTVKSLDLFHLPSGATASAPVKLLFLATGGIENPRLMLWSGRKYATGNPFSGGPNLLTGKYFMEHPSVSPVEIYIDSRADLSALAPHANADRMENVVLRPSDAFLSAHNLPRFGMHFQDPPQPASTDIEIQSNQDLFVAHSTGYTRIMPFFIFEQTPDPSSYVALSQKFGRDQTPLARLNWAISPDELQRYRQAVLLFCGLLNQYGLAKSRFTGDSVNADWSTLGFGDAAHQMGTTRMAHTAAGGVVDSNCKVFGIDNMYVAGASVFPTTDYVNPTLNLTALAARLASFILATRTTTTGATYRFGAGRDANAALGTGWSKPEDAGVWSDGDSATLSLVRNGAKALTFVGAGFEVAQVEVEINGVSVFKGAATDLAGKSMPLGQQDKVVLALHFTELKSPKENGTGTDARALGLFLQSLVLQ